MCKEIRRHSERIPVVMLTALNTTSDKIEGFDAGADDYIVKPFDFKELLVRIRALLKRIYQNVPTGNILKVADLTMNLDSKEVTPGRQTHLAYRQRISVAGIPDT